MANQQGNGRNSDHDEDNRYRDRDDERFMQRERERSGASWDDRSSRGFDRDDDRSVGWRSIDRGGMGQSGYGSGREGDRSFDQRNPGYPRSFDERSRGNYLGQGGQEMGSRWGNDMGHGSDQRAMYQQGYGGGGGLQGSGWQQNPQSFGYDQRNQGYGYDQRYGGGYNQGYGYQHQQQPYMHTGGGMGLGQHGNFRHQPYSHLGEHNFGHIGPDQGAHMSSSSMGDYGRDYGYPHRYDYGYGRMQSSEWNRGPEYSRGEWRAREDDRDDHESLGQRIKHWLQGHRGKGPSGYQRSDERIRENVCEALSDDDRVDASNIEVTVKNGEVTLSGLVPDRETKRLAEDCIENLSGVKDVQNNIRVMSRDMSRHITGVGTGSSMETPSTTTPGNGADKRHRA